jgi:galactonate dehydratase
MRITSVETFVISNRQVLVKVDTDAGIAGWGEPVLENWALATVAAVDRLAEHLIGEDPRATTRLWQVMWRGGFYRGGPVLGSAVAGLDQALWDIKGRALGAPIHELLGGPTRDVARVYAHANTHGRTGDPEQARALVAAGIDLVKIAPDGPVAFLESSQWIDGFVHDVSELRDAIGTDASFAIDFHGRLSLPMSRIVLPLLEPFRPAFVEEPLRPEHSHLVGALVDASPIPIAVGERLYERHEYRAVLDAGVAIIQPDLSHAGGITECLRIAAMAETHDVQVAPHCPLGVVALAACLQLDFAIPNFYAQEQGLNVHYSAGPAADFLVDPSVLRAVDGAIPRLLGAGLGIEIDEDAVRAAVADGLLTPGSPVWSYADGGFAEW